MDKVFDVAATMSQRKESNIFEAAADAQRIAMKLGRQQMALEIIRLFDNELDDAKALKGIFDLCRKEAP